MYRSLCIFALFFFAFSASAERLLSLAEETCRYKHNIDVTVAKNVSLAPLLDPKTRCYWTCVLTELKLRNPDGTTNVQMTAKTFPEETAPDKSKLVAVLQACANQPGKDVCEKAYNAYKCHRTHAVWNKYWPED